MGLMIVIPDILFIWFEKVNVKYQSQFNTHFLNCLTVFLELPSVVLGVCIHISAVPPKKLIKTHFVDMT